MSAVNTVGDEGETRDPVSADGEAGHRRKAAVSTGSSSMLVIVSSGQGNEMVAGLKREQKSSLPPPVCY